MSPDRPSGDYLFDKSGPPDPEVARLEELLAPLAHDGRPLSLPAEPIELHRRRRPFRLALQMAAALSALAAGLATYLLLRAPSWSVEVTDGTARIGTSDVHGRARLRSGQEIATGDAGRAVLRVKTVGEVELGPSSVLRVVEARATDHRLSLQRGRLLARIWAPPRLFTIDTPSATAVDLGCIYALNVDDDGNGELSVKVGWVAFVANGRESFVPAAASAETRRGAGPGTPRFDDAPQSFKAALRAVDYGPAEQHAEAFGAVLAASRDRDALTLWHLLSRVSGDERERVYARLTAAVPPPPGVTREGILAGDRRMLDTWWNALGLGTATWWRLWRQSPPTT